MTRIRRSILRLRDSVVPATILALGLSVRPVVVSGQHAVAEGGPWDPVVPAPASVLGHELGDRPLAPGSRPTVR